MQFSVIPVIFLLINAAYSLAQSSNVSLILNGLMENYDPRIRPQYGGPPVEVNVTAYILAISSISEANMDITMNLYFRQMWTDERLKFKSSNGLTDIALDSTSVLKIWEPDTFFSNEKTAFVHHIFKPNKFIRIESNGNIMTSSRLTITAACPMNLQYFPMDSQLCSLEAESYAMKATDITYRWGGKLGISPEVILPEFKVVGHRTSNKLLQMSIGAYSRLVLYIQVTRAVGYYVLSAYMPAILIVLISWTAFYVNNLVVRVIIGVIATLAAMFLTGYVNASMPHVSYVKAIDVYMGTCVAMVFATLVINTLIEHLASAQNAHQHHRQKDGSGCAADVEGRSGGKPRLTKFRGLPANMTDRISLIGLFAIFVTFNFLYFLIYSIVSDVLLEND